MRVTLQDYLRLAREQVEHASGCDSFSPGGCPCDCDWDERFDARVAEAIEAAMAAGAETVLDEWPDECAPPEMWPAIDSAGLAAFQRVIQKGTDR